MIATFAPLFNFIWNWIAQDAVQRSFLNVLRFKSVDAVEELNEYNENAKYCAEYDSENCLNPPVDKLNRW